MSSIRVYLKWIIKAHIVENVMDEIRLSGGQPEEHLDLFNQKLIEATDHFSYSPFQAPTLSLRDPEDSMRYFANCPSVEENTFDLNANYTKVIQLAPATLLIIYSRINAKSCKFILPEEFTDYCDKAKQVVSLAEEKGWTFKEEDNIFSAGEGIWE